MSKTVESYDENLKKQAGVNDKVILSNSSQAYEIKLKQFVKNKK
jgi:hypothetical protein